MTNTSPDTKDLQTLYVRQYSLACAGIAQHYAAAGDSWHALHAQVLSYTAAAEWVLRIHDQDPTPVLTAIASDIETLEDSVQTDKTGTDVLSHVLQQFATHLPGDVVADFFAVIISPHDIELHAPVVADLHNAVMVRWLDGQSPTAFIAQRRHNQVAKLTTARELIEQGDTEAATLAIHDADVAAFEAWLVEHALDTHDVSFTRARIQWDFFVESLSNLSYLPADIYESVDMVRSRMAWPLGPQNARRFAEAIPEL